jgi:hypothetical protein
MIQLVHMKSCQAAQKCFLLFSEIGGKVAEVMAYRLISFTSPPPLPFYSTSTFTN